MNIGGRLRGGVIRWGIDAAILVSVGLTAWRLLDVYGPTHGTTAPPPAAAVARALEAGDSLEVPDRDQLKGTRGTIVLALGSTCPGSLASVELYKELISRVKTDREWDVVVVGQDNDTELESWVSGFGVTANQLRRSNLAELGIWGTPALFLVDRDNRITDEIVGPLDALEERRLWARLRGDPSASLLGYRPTEKRRGEANQSSQHFPQLIDIRGRGTVAPSDRGAKWIPLAELLDRSQVELSRGEAVTIDCIDAQYAVCRSAAQLLHREGFAVALLLPEE